MGGVRASRGGVTGVTVMNLWAGVRVFDVFGPRSLDSCPLRPGARLGLWHSDPVTTTSTGALPDLVAQTPAAASGPLGSHLVVGGEAQRTNPVKPTPAFAGGVLR
jgi:hypothetical protein